MTDVPIPDELGKPSPHEDRLLFRFQPFLMLIIAFAAIGLTVWEGAENRRHNRLSVQPRIGAGIDAGRDTAGEYVKMTIESTGLGPAVIRTFRIYFDGVAQDTVTASGTTPWQRVIEALPTNATQIHARGLGSEYYFPAGREQVLFEARRRALTGDEPALAETVRRLAIQICYCSIYNTDCEEVVLTTARFKGPGCMP